MFNKNIKIVLAALITIWAIYQLSLFNIMNGISILFLAGIFVLLYFKNEFIFFSNYNSPKASSFNSHNQISALMYWSSINVQIRMKAKINKTSNKYNQKYFFDRSEEKNALAISSSQSKPIASYKQVKKNYNKSFKNDDLKECPEFWGGFSFTPYYFKFWEGHESRINKREAYKKSDGSWEHLILQP